MSAIEESESFSGRSGELGRRCWTKMVESVVQQFDERNGGFGSQPKFPHSGAMDLLIDAASRRGGEHAERAKTVATVTLRKMAKAGSMTSWRAGFIATRSMSGGLCRTSKRWRTTTASC